jgi:hypothetical protein
MNRIVNSDRILPSREVLCHFPLVSEQKSGKIMVGISPIDGGEDGDDGGATIPTLAITIVWTQPDEPKHDSAWTKITELSLLTVEEQIMHSRQSNPGTAISETIQADAVPLEKPITIHFVRALAHISS